MSQINLSPDLALPIDAITETFVILAKRGSGKTYTAAVMAEQMIGAGHPVVVIDPIGVWWGLRSSADGKSDGLPVAIFGGDHADLPLDEHGGAVVADAIVTERFSAIIDLSLLSKAASKRFMTAFIERLYHRNRDPLHIVVDEADAFAPQRGGADGARLLGAMEDLVRRGRARGIGCTLITQRPAVLNKDVLTQAEVLICLRMNGVRDVAAIDEWVRLHADESEAAEMKRSLPSLPVGTAWIWSPGWLGLLERVKIASRTTFDSSSTPSVGKQRIVPKQMADIDLTALGDKIAATAEEVKASDPKHLRAEVARLTRDLEKVASAPAPAVETVEVSVLTQDDRDLLLHLQGVLTGVATLAEPLREVTSRVAAGARPSPTPSSPSTAVASASQPATSRSSRPAAEVGDVRLGKTERTLLTVLAQHGTVTHDQLALLSGYSPKASTIGVSLAKLRRAGLVHEGQPISATTEGVDWLDGGYTVLPTGQALVDYWRSRFGLTEQRVLDALIWVYPNTTNQAEVAEIAGYSPTASTVGVALSKLRKVGVVAGWRLSDDFAMLTGIAS